MVDNDVDDVLIMQFYCLEVTKLQELENQITNKHTTTRDQLRRSEFHKIALFVAQLQHNREPNNNATMTVGKRCRKSRCDNFDQRRCRANSRDALCWILHVNASFCADDRVSLVGNGYRRATDRKLLASRRQRGRFADTVLSTLADIRRPMNRKRKASFAQRHAQIAERLNRTVG